MKKTKSIRIAAGLLVLTLITSCFVGGTFAKYVTKATGDGNDLARVAMWGVKVETGSSDLFATSYAKDTPDGAGNYYKDSKTGDNIENTVVSSTGEKVVAPGTKKEGVSLFSITGKPEVAVNVKLELAAPEGKDAITDVVLPAGTYTDYTGTSQTFTVGEDYHPVEFILKNGDTEVVKGTLAQIQTELNNLSLNYQANTDLSTVFGEEGYNLSWEWKFEDGADAAAKTLTDQMDTYLGQMAAGTTDANATPDVSGAAVSTAFDFVLSITVTQID